MQVTRTKAKAQVKEVQEIGESSSSHTRLRFDLEMRSLSPVMSNSCFLIKGSIVSRQHLLSRSATTQRKL